MRPPTLTFGPFAFDPQSRVLRRGEQELALPPRVLGVLEVLLNRAGDVVSRQELIASVWKDAFVTDTSLAEAVSLLRQALGDDAQTPVYIQTLHRRGYRFVAPVGGRMAEASAAAVATADSVVNGGENVTDFRVAQGAAGVVRPSIGWQLVPWSIAIICAAVAVVAAWHAIRRGQSVDAPIMRFSIALPPGTRFDTRALALALSPDGSSAAWSACDDSGCRLYMRPVDRLDATAIPGTEGAAAPFFSPDGRSVAFFADGRLKKVSLAGGAPVTLADAADALGGVWTMRGRIIYAGAAHGLLQISDEGSDPEVLTAPRQTLGEVRHIWPALSGEGSHLYFTIATTPDSSTGGRIGVLRLDDAMRSWQTLLAGVGVVRDAGDDALVFSRAGELQAIAFDRLRLTTAGTPITVVDSVARAPGGAQFAVSRSGTLLYAPPAVGSAEPYVWWTAGGTSTATGHVRDLIAPALSPDGTRLAGSDAVDGVRGDIWVADLRRGATTRLTHGGLNVSPIWSADGSTVYYASRGRGAFEIWRRDAEGTKPAERLHSSEHHAFPVSSSADGALLAFVRQTPASRSDIWALPLGGGVPQPIVESPFDEIAAAFSPDGSLVAYQSNEAGRWDIFVRRRADGRKIPVSPDGGTAPFWSPDGRVLFYSVCEWLMRVEIAPDAASRVAVPERVGNVPGAAVIGRDSTGRLLLHRRTFSAADRAIVTVNWARELRQLLGPPAASLPR